MAAFETRLNQDAYAIADRLWVKDRLDPDEEKLRFSNRRGLERPPASPALDLLPQELWN